MMSGNVVRYREDFHQNGFVVFRKLFSRSEVRQWQKECDRLWTDPEISSEQQFRVDKRQTLIGQAVRERLDPVTDASDVFKSLSRDVRLTSIATALLDAEARLFKDKLIVKQPNTLGYELHQDFAYIAHFGFNAKNQLAIAVAIDECNSMNGAIEVLAGQHHELLTGRQDDSFLVDTELLDENTTQAIEMAPGDTLVMHSLCPHASAPNRSESQRRMIFFTYNSIETGDLYQTYYKQGKP